MKRFLAILLVAVVAVGLLFYSQQISRSQKPKVSGFIEADEIRLVSRVGGRVEKVHVVEGDRVNKGMLLVELEPFDLLEREQEASAKTAAAKANYDRLKAGFRPEEIAQAAAKFQQLQAKVDRLKKGPRSQEIAAAESLLKVANAELVLARQTFNRTRDLFQRKTTTQSEMDRATQQFNAATSRVMVRSQELNLLNEGTRPEEIAEAEALTTAAQQAFLLAQNGYRQEEIAQAKATHQAAMAALAAVQKQIGELRIVSPVESGVVESMELQPGDFAGANAPVMSIMDTNNLWVRAYVPESLLHLKEGQKLRIEVSSFPDRSFEGKVTFISRQAEFTPSNVQTPEERSKQVFRIKVTLTTGQELLRPGMTADVWLPEAGGSP